MKLPSPYICDECGTQKKESNHWWMLARGRSYHTKEFRTAYVLLPWEDPDGADVTAHLCSESCATKALSKWMASLQRANAQFKKPCSTCGEEMLAGEPFTPASVGSLKCPYLDEAWHREASADSTKQSPVLYLWRRRVQSANAGKPQPANDSPEERHKTRGPRNRE